MNDHEETRHFRTRAITMPAIATGALGFGFFEAEFRVSTELLPVMKLSAGGLALVCYVALAESVRFTLQDGDVTGRQVARGPLRAMFLVVFCVVSVFVIEIFEGPPPAREGAGHRTTGCEQLTPPRSGTRG